MSNGEKNDQRSLRLMNWVLMALIYLSWLLVTWFHQWIPLWLLLPIGAILIAWHGSFQHEAIHGHFADRPWLNDLAASPPLSLWLPFPIYRETHQAHHSFKILTDPWRDPESFYIDRAGWARLPMSIRRVLVWHNTLLGRLLLGPPLIVGQFLISEGRSLKAGDRRHLAIWFWHILALIPILIWLVVIVDMSVWVYLGCFVLPGLSLTLLRSFAEHKAAGSPLERTAIVEAGSLLSLLFLNNNLHFAHHCRPDLPWQALPAFYRRHRIEMLKQNGGLVYKDGYREIARRFTIQPVDDPEHPFC